MNTRKVKHEYEDDQLFEKLKLAIRRRSIVYCKRRGEHWVLYKLVPLKLCRRVNLILQRNLSFPTMPDIIMTDIGVSKSPESLTQGRQHALITSPPEC